MFFLECRIQVIFITKACPHFKPAVIKSTFKWASSACLQRLNKTNYLFCIGLYWDQAYLRHWLLSVDLVWKYFQRFYFIYISLKKVLLKGSSKKWKLRTKMTEFCLFNFITLKQTRLKHSVHKLMQKYSIFNQKKILKNQVNPFKNIKIRKIYNNMTNKKYTKYEVIDLN